MTVLPYVNEWPAPDGTLVAKWRGGGELWMSGPEWGWLAVDECEEIKGAMPEVMWSQNGQFLAFVKLHIEDVPTRQGVEGFSFRVGVMRLADRKISYCFGNSKLSPIQINSFDSECLVALIGGQEKRLPLKLINWDGAQ